MKKGYFVLDTINKDGLYYTVVCPVNIECDNVYSLLTRWAGSNDIKASLLCATKKRAFEICDAWREAHKKQGNAENLGFF